MLGKFCERTKWMILKASIISSRFLNFVTVSIVPNCLKISLKIIGTGASEDIRATFYKFLYNLFKCQAYFNVLGHFFDTFLKL